MKLNQGIHILIFSLWLFITHNSVSEIDLTHAVVVVPQDITVTHQAAVDMLLDEVEKRTAKRFIPLWRNRSPSNPLSLASQKS